MTMVIEFLMVFKKYLIEILPYLAIGFLLSGLIHEFVPTQLVEKHLGTKGIRPLLYSILILSLPGQYRMDRAIRHKEKRPDN